MTTSPATTDSEGFPLPPLSLPRALAGVAIQAIAAAILLSVDTQPHSALALGPVAISGALVAVLALMAAFVGALLAMPGALLPTLFVASIFLAFFPAIFLVEITVHAVPLYRVLHLATDVDGLVVRVTATYWVLANLFCCALAAEVAPAA